MAKLNCNLEVSFHQCQETDINYYYPPNSPTLTQKLDIPQTPDHITKIVTITPEIIRPYPKAVPRKTTRRGRQPGKTKILTKTPEKITDDSNEILKKTTTKAKGSDVKREHHLKFRRKERKTLMVWSFIAWPFAFQHGGALSYAISQRWSINSQANDSSNINSRNSNMQVQDNFQNVINCNDNYGQDYSENDYEDRGYEDRGYEELNDSSGPSMQYCNYGYKEDYYEMRNTHPCDSLMNNV
ncbi:unnamed protein product [Parnassius apollo]|uniref:(apollo) hypothetical protein n=1 Tax=Parnassius apollo TaxID=110799 RepID=A0A8S3XIQ8_PARAO|nr:unnamed protein product [Parnassius apollo]